MPWGKLPPASSDPIKKKEFVFRPKVSWAMVESSSSDAASEVDASRTKIQVEYYSGLKNPLTCEAGKTVDCNILILVARKSMENPKKTSEAKPRMFSEEISHAYPWSQGTDALPCLFKSSSAQL